MAGKKITWKYEFHQKFDKVLHWKTIPRDENKLPVFIGNSETYWALIKSWEGEILIENTIYILHVEKSLWYVKGYNKRRLPNDIHLKIIKVHEDFRKAMENEKRIRKSLVKDTRLADNKRYYNENKTKILEQREKSFKAMAIQNQLQLNEIYKMIIEGKARFEIEESLKNNYGFSLRRANQLITAASTMIKKEVDGERASLKDKHHLMLMDLYKRSLEECNFRECRMILETMNRLYGLNEVQTQKVEVQNVIKFNFDNNIIKKSEIENEIQDATYEDIKNQSLPEHDDENEFTNEDEKIERMKEERNKNNQQNNNESTTTEIKEP